MGANNSTCLPCKAAGHSGARRGRSGGLGERFSSLIPLKKISTAADNEQRLPSDQESQIGRQFSTPIEEHSPRTDNPDQPNITVLRGASSKAAHLSAEVDLIQRDDLSANINEGETCVSPSRRAQSSGQSQVHDETAPSLEDVNALGNNIYRNDSKPINDVEHAESVRLQENGSQPSLNPAIQTSTSVDAPGQRHVPTHLLMESDQFGSNDLRRQHSNLQDLLSPHSRAVAHRVAAALRAAAGERAAAAASLAAAAASMSRAESYRALQQEEDGPVACDSAATTTSTEEGGEACDNAGNAFSGIGLLAWASTTNIAPLSCFKRETATTEEFSISQRGPLRTEQGHDTRDTISRSSEEIVLDAVKRLNAIIIEAANAALTAAATGSNAAKERLERHLAIFLRKHEDVEHGGDNTETALDAETLKQGVDVLAKALESTIHTLNGSDLKQQASTLLAQTIGVAAALVEAVKTCTDAEGPAESTSLNESKESFREDRSLDYFETLRISAQQQLQKIADAEQQRRLDQLVKPTPCMAEKGSGTDSQNLKIFVLRENGQLAEQC